MIFVKVSTKKMFVCRILMRGSHITLLLKKSSPLTVSDYIPISLLNMSIKLVTKILVNRLQKVISILIHKNQYGFIKGRTIHDCLAWAFENIYMKSNGYSKV
jgi:hypothetical protein